MKSNNRIIEVWVPSGIPEIQVEQIRSRYTGTGCLVVIYRSGREDLIELTKHLLSINI